MQVGQTGGEMTWSTRAGQKRGEPRTGDQNREAQGKEVPGQGEGERLGSRILVKEEDQDK